MPNIGKIRSITFHTCWIRKAEDVSYFIEVTEGLHCLLMRLVILIHRSRALLEAAGWSVYVILRPVLNEVEGSIWDPDFSFAVVEKRFLHDNSCKAESPRKCHVFLWKQTLEFIDIKQCEGQKFSWIKNWTEVHLTRTTTGAINHGSESRFDLTSSASEVQF